ncbi:MAG: DUF2182 domain-containing protein [Vicinamibacterales bacterium]
MTPAAAGRGLPVAAGAVAMAAAWAVLAGSSVGVPHQHAGAGGVSGFALAVVMWQAMVVAMMTPTVAPWIAAYVTFVSPGRTRPWQAAASFASGYFAAWLAYSAGMAGVQVLAGRAESVRAVLASPAAAGVALLAAGLYQFLPAKTACLTHCRNPIGFFLARWRRGPTSGFRLGLAHGAYCLGCCWLLMATALALGLMNLAWMAVVTAIVVVEQLAPRGLAFGRVAGVALAAWGGWLLAARWLAG